MLEQKNVLFIIDHLFRKVVILVIYLVEKQIFHFCDFELYPVLLMFRNLQLLFEKSLSPTVPNHNNRADISIIHNLIQPT